MYRNDVINKSRGQNKVIKGICCERLISWTRPVQLEF